MVFDVQSAMSAETVRSEVPHFTCLLYPLHGLPHWSFGDIILIPNVNVFLADVILNLLH